MNHHPVALLAWELGEGLCHARRLLTIARALKDRGWSPVVAARELWACTDEYRSAGIPLVQAPSHRGVVASNVRFAARSFADMMAACGYQQADALWPTVVGWDYLVDLLKPAVVVADYSPILALAAFGRVPMVTIGDGYVAPPGHLPTMLRFRAEGTAMATEAEMLDHAAEVQRRRGYPAPPNLPTLVAGQAQVVCTFPETDIYASHRLAPATGPLDHVEAALPPPKRRAFFAYLDGNRTTSRKFLQALVNTGDPVEAFVRNCSPELDSALRRSGVTVHPRPPSLADVLSRASLVAHHGGIGTAEACLALGRPQLLLPNHTEQSLNSEKLSKNGVAARLPSSQSVSEWSDLAKQAITSGALLGRAEELAGVISRRGRPRSLEEVIESCERLARSGVDNPA